MTPGGGVECPGSPDARLREGAAGAPAEGARANRDLSRDNRAKGEIALETHTSPQAAAGAGAKEAGREGGKSRREGPTGGTAGGRGGGGREGGTRRLGGNSAPPPPARRGRQHGRGSRARGPLGLSFPSRLAGPRGTARTRLPRSSRRAPGAPHVARPGARSSGRDAPHRVSEKTKTKTKPLHSRGTPDGYIRPPWFLALTGFGPSPALPIVIERLPCGGTARGRAERVGKAGRCPEDPVRGRYARHRGIPGQMPRALGATREFWGFLREVEPRAPDEGGQEDMNAGKDWGERAGAAGANVPRVRVLQKNSSPLLSRARLLCLRYLFESQPILPPPNPVL